MAQPENPGPAEGSLISHLLELRDRLLYSVVAIVAVFIVLLVFVGTGEVYTLLAKPLMDVLPSGASMVATEVASPFLTPMKLTLAVSVVVSIPFLLYQIWAFVAPGLYRHERRLVLPLVLSSTLLFYGGMAFAYFVVFPMAFGFFIDTLPPGVTMMTDIRSYMDFVFSMFFAFGLAFEVPIAVILLTRMGVINPETLAKKRPYVVLWAFIVAAVITPPDILSQFFLAVPMIILFEIGLLVARAMKRAADAAVDSGRRNLTDDEIEAEFKKHDEALADPAGKDGK